MVGEGEGHGLSAHPSSESDSLQYEQVSLMAPKRVQLQHLTCRNLSKSATISFPAEAGWDGECVKALPSTAAIR